MQNNTIGFRSNYSLIHLRRTIEKLADNIMNIEILHNVFGSITVDDEGKISVRKPDLAERLTWLLKHEDDLYGLAHYQTGLAGRLIAVMEYLGIAGGITKVTAEGEQELPPGTVY